MVTQYRQPIIANSNLEALERSSCFLEKEGSIVLFILANNLKNASFIKITFSKNKIKIVSCANY